MAGNPFFDAYIHADLMGKMIFIALVLLSILSWAIVIYKYLITSNAKKSAIRFSERFSKIVDSPLSLEVQAPKNGEELNPFQEVYQVMKRQTIEILRKNQRFGEEKQGQSSFLSPSDIDIVASHLSATIGTETKKLEKHLFILATIVSLAPFLGLLGTVWGILTTFSEMQMQTGTGNQQMVLGGISLALGTTVLGLIDAIPALVGYNYLKNEVQQFDSDLRGFSTRVLAAVEMHYRKVGV